LRINSIFVRNDDRKMDTNMSVKRLITRYLRERAGGLIEFQKQTKSEGEQQIIFLNWWKEDDAHRDWLRRFIQSRGLLKNKSVTICSLFGPRSVPGWAQTDVRIFFSGENLHLPRCAHYADYMLSGPNPFDLGLGFDCFEDEHYLRFPLWLTYMFPPESTNDDIIRICNSLRYPIGNSGNKYCSLVSRWDPNGVRGRMYEALSQYGHISCPSDFLHNDDDLKQHFNDNKSSYLRQFRYNICPENSNAIGYTTEKIFECINAGCIPVYYGNFGNPEPGILNHEAILIWNDNGDNHELLSKIHELESNNSSFEAFRSQPRLLPTAEEQIIKMFDALERKIALL